MELKSFMKRVFIPLNTLALLLCSCANGLLIRNHVRDNNRSIIIDDQLDSISTSISLNEYKTKYLGPGQIGYYKFTPSDNRYYVIDVSSSSYNTKVQALSNGFNTVVTTNYGTNDNSILYIHAQQSMTIYFQVRFYNSYNSGFVTAQIRKQTFSMFAFNYGLLDINTTGDMTSPGNTFGSIFDCHANSNYTVSQATATDDRHLPKINSEISFFAGHGAPGSLKFSNNTLYNTSNTTSLNKVRVGVLASCESAKTKPGVPVSIAEYFTNKGAKSCLGFVESINNDVASDFTDYLFARLYIGESLSDASYYAASNSASSSSDPIYSYQIFGLSTINIMSTSNSNTTWARQKGYSYLELCELTENYFNETIAVNLKNNIVRFYEAINDYPTDNYIDVKLMGSEYLIINEHIIDYEAILPCDFSFIERYTPLPSIINDEYKFEKVKTDLAYYNINGIMTPVYVSYNTYRNQDNYSLLKTDCINLYNGENIDYNSIRNSK